MQTPEIMHPYVNTVLNNSAVPEPLFRIRPAFKRIDFCCLQDPLFPMFHSILIMRENASRQQFQKS